MYWEYIVWSQYMGGLKWKPCYKKSRALASARVPPLLHTYIGPIRWVCVFIPVDICNTVFWLAANIYGINAVAFWLEDMCVPQDALSGWKDLWIMQFCIPDAMHKQQQMCAAYKRQNSLFSSNAACVSCCETSWRILCSATPFSWKVQVWGHSATMPKVVAISPIWARQPQLFSMRLIPGKDKGVRKSALSSTRPSRNFLEKITTKCAQRWNSTICGAWHETTMFKSNQGGFGYKPLDTHFSIFIPKVSKSKYWWRLIICQRPSRGNLEPMTLSSSLDSRLIHNLGNPLLPQPTWCV